MIYLVEVTGASAGGAITIFRYGTEGYVTLPTDTPANTYWEGRVKTPGLLRQSMFSSGRTSGESEVGYGVIELVNNDGALDHLIDYAFDGWPLKIYTLEDDNASFSSAVVRFSGTMEQAEFDDTLMVLRVRDLMQSLDKPIQTVTYAGTNVGASGLEGSSDSLKGKVKPLAFGTVFNVAPAQANTTALIYQVNDGPISTCNVFDRGIALTKGADYTSLDDLKDNIPAAGHYRVLPTHGYFRLGSTPSGMVTADVVQSAAGTSTADTIQAIMAMTGVGALHAPDVAALNGINPAPVGIYINSETTVLQAISDLTNSIGAYCMFDNESRLRLGRLELPSGTPDHTLDDWEILDISRTVSSDTERGIPAYKVTVKYGRNYVVQTMTDIAAAAQVQSERRGIDYRNASNQDDSVKLQYPLSEELVRETLLVNEADAQAEASRLLNIYKTRRDFFEVTCRTDKQIEIGQTVHVTYPRFLLNNGKLLRVLAVEPDYTLNRNILTLWG